MKKSVLFIFAILFLSCKEKNSRGVSLDIATVKLNNSNSDVLSNTLISFSLFLTNESSNKVFFISSIKNDNRKKSRLILVDTIYNKSIDIETGDVHVLKKNQTKHILGFVNLLDENNRAFFYNEENNSLFTKNRVYTIKKLNEKLKSCKIYYIQNETDINIMSKQGYKNISFIEDSLKTKTGLVIN